MRHVLEALTSPQAVAARGAELVVRCARTAVADHDRFTFAVSGGPHPMGDAH